jgi:hypothetical protein
LLKFVPELYFEEELHFEDMEDVSEGKNDDFLTSADELDSKFDRSLSRYQSWTGVGCGLIFAELLESSNSLTVIATFRRVSDFWLTLEDTKVKVKLDDDSHLSRSCS